ncbi:fasciclin domain-containing protein [Methanosphaerula subterraneus]|uniref:fasciclin domain-containing protein n=1 Tax=Methanosphaerula subterraneus TaxID=3350244 RepID=UPI003F8488CF
MRSPSASRPSDGLSIEGHTLILPSLWQLKKATKLTSSTTVQSRTVMIAVKNGSVMINVSHVIVLDIECSNGVCHGIDAVQILIIT